MTEPGKPIEQARGSADETVVYSYPTFGDDSEVASLSPLELVNTVLRQRRMIAGITLAVIVSVLVLTVLLRGWRAEASFAPSSSGSGMSQVAGLAAQFGVNLSSLQNGPSLDFFAALATSRVILADAVETQYVFTTDNAGRDTVRTDLIALYDVSGDSPNERLLGTIKRLDNHTTVTKDEDAGLITLHVTAKWPQLAEQIAGRILGLVNEFNLHAQQSQAGAERRFIQERLGAVRSELDSAENALKEFLQNNLTYQGSPRLQLEVARLQRHVDLVQQVYTTLSQAYEQARIQEVRNTPVVTIVDRPAGSARHSVRLAVAGLLSLIVGVLVGVLMAFLRDYGRRQRVVEADTFREFAELRQATIRDFLLVPRGVARLLRRGR